MRTYRNQGFTLIELLVVIAIIAILAAILFPVFTNAKESGRRSQCINQLKQIGMATLNYADNWNGYLPPYGVTGWNPNAPAPLDPNLPHKIVRDAIKPYIKNDKVWKCPSDNGYKPYNVKPSAYVYYGGSYPFNNFIVEHTEPKGKAKLFTTCKSSQKLIFFWDWVSHPIETTWIQNTIFADGHVRALTNRQLADGVGATPTLW